MLSSGENVSAPVPVHDAVVKAKFYAGVVGVAVCAFLSIKRLTAQFSPFSSHVNLPSAAAVGSPDSIVSPVSSKMHLKPLSRAYCSAAVPL